MDAALFGLPRPGVHDEFQLPIGGGYLRAWAAEQSAASDVALPGGVFTSSSTRPGPRSTRRAWRLSWLSGIARLRPSYRRRLAGERLGPCAAHGSGALPRAGAAPIGHGLGGMLLALHPIMHLWSTKLLGRQASRSSAARWRSGAFLAACGEASGARRSALLFGFGLALPRRRAPFRGCCPWARCSGSRLRVASLGPRGRAVERSGYCSSGSRLAAALPSQASALATTMQPSRGIRGCCPYVAYTAPARFGGRCSCGSPYRKDLRTTMRSSGKWPTGNTSNMRRRRQPSAFLSKSASRIVSLLSRLLLPQGILVVSLLVLPATLARSGMGTAAGRHDGHFSGSALQRNILSIALRRSVLSGPCSRCWSCV